MANESREQLMAEFQRGGTRTYAETAKLLRSWGFHERKTSGGHAIWIHPRGSTLTLTRTWELKTFYQKLVVKEIRKVHELTKYD